MTADPLSGRAQLYRSVAEEHFQRAVIDALHMNGWTVAHFRPAGGGRNGAWKTPVQADGAGFPDLIAVRDRVIYRELKTMIGRLSAQQQEWGERLTAAGADWAVWRPDMMPAILSQIKREERPM